MIENIDGYDLLLGNHIIIDENNNIIKEYNKDGFLLDFDNQYSDTKIDNAKFKHFFGIKAHMLPFAEVEALIGHAPGGVCPFGVNEGVKVYLDVSMKRFPTMFPAAGEENNAIELTPDELEKYTVNDGWVDLCKGWQEN